MPSSPPSLPSSHKDAVLPVRRGDQVKPSPPTSPSQQHNINSDSSTISGILRSSEKSFRTKKRRQHGSKHRHRSGTRDVPTHTIYLSDADSGSSRSLTSLPSSYPPQQGASSPGSLLSRDQLQQTPTLWHSSLVADSGFGESPSSQLTHPPGATPQELPTPRLSASMSYEVQSEGERTRSICSSRSSSSSSSAIL